MNIHMHVLTEIVDLEIYVLMCDLLVSNLLIFCLKIDFIFNLFFKYEYKIYTIPLTLSS